MYESETSWKAYMIVSPPQVDPQTESGKVQNHPRNLHDYSDPQVDRIFTPVQGAFADGRKATLCNMTKSHTPIGAPP